MSEHSRVPSVAFPSVPCSMPVKAFSCSSPRAHTKALCAGFPCSSEHRNHRTLSGHSPVQEIFLERKMLKHLFKDAIKSPVKLFLLCFVVYMAAASFLVAAFLFLLGARWLHKQMMLKAKALEAAEVEASKAEVAKAAEAVTVVATPVDVKATPAPASANAANDASVEAAPAPQYAKSAVVLPFKTATR
ncbi:hypothetical protein [Paraburkholderia sp. GAS334]|uniref:hypothetical protein n=1 Tax=Paraburkholderia sp. GAS334 TaxID=3035131 RepID=UPI003D1E1633